MLGVQLQELSHSAIPVLLQGASFHTDGYDLFTPQKSALQEHLFEFHQEQNLCPHQAGDLCSLTAVFCWF